MRPNLVEEAKKEREKEAAKAGKAAASTTAAGEEEEEEEEGDKEEEEDEGTPQAPEGESVGGDDDVQEVFCLGSSAAPESSASSDVVETFASVGARERLREVTLEQRVARLDRRQASTVSSSSSSEAGSQTGYSTDYTVTGDTPTSWRWYAEMADDLGRDERKLPRAVRQRRDAVAYDEFLRDY